MKTFYTFLTIIFYGQLSFSQCESFEVDLTFTNPLCPDYADGSVSAPPTGGTSPYVIQITDSDGFICNLDGGSETGFLLLEGWYYISVVDAMGCTFEDSVLLVDPLGINVDDYTIVEPSDVDECDGSITIEDVSGDYENLFYGWTPDPDGISGIDANSLTDACADTYNLVIANEVGCTMSYDFEIGVGLSISENLTQSVSVLNSINGIYIDLESPVQMTFHITNLSGQTFLTSNVQNGENFISFERTGFFIYTLVDDNGLILYREKRLR